MRWVEGGVFSVGTLSGSFNNEEGPQFKTKIASFCYDETEVTVARYAECVAAGDCTKARENRHYCNARFDDRPNHPINCIDWTQADAYCKFRSARLPQETEWEFAARGGTEMLEYPWGNEAPDGKLCWKHAGSCEVKTYPAGAFGLYDIVGNVWEWTDDWFADYPWRAKTGFTRVYRGASWSRRFEKWLRPQLRNRYGPNKSGSHLGFRCALTPKSVQCPYGRDESGLGCQRGVESVECQHGLEWNGVRCAAKGAPRCPKGSEEEPGYGCIGAGGSGKWTPPPVDTSGITRSRSPEFDADCIKNAPGRPHAYRYAGGSHVGRNQVSRKAGCKNRDVGVGWNSTCCP